MAHRLISHKSRCRFLHGHTYTIEIGVDGEVITDKGSSEGMVIDFGDVKKIAMEKIHNVFDHGTCLFEGDIIAEKLKDEDLNIILVPFNPTAENLAHYWYTLVREPLKRKGVKLKYVNVWETPNSTAMYEEV